MQIVDWFISNLEWLGDTMARTKKPLVEESVFSRSEDEKFRVSIVIDATVETIDIPNAERIVADWLAAGVPAALTVESRFVKVSADGRCDCGCDCC